MKQILPVLFLFFCIFLYFPSSIQAVTISISNFSTSIDINQEFTVDVNLTCSGCGVSYLRGVFFYPESSTTYSGYTQNNAGEWVNFSSAQATNYFKIDEGSWSGPVKFRFDSVKPVGEYFFKVGRYTSNNGSLFGSSPTSIVVTSTTPSPTATQSPTPTQTPTSTPTTTATPTSSKSTYKINTVKDSDGAIISNIKIYVDGGYTHHYAPESITFCASCHCDDSNEVDCDLGIHTIKLVKEGYADWSEQKTFNSGENFEVNPIFSKNVAETTSTPSPTPVKTSTTTPSPAPTKTPTLTSSIKRLQGQALQATPSSVLGNSTSSSIVIASDGAALLDPPRGGISDIKSSPNPSVLKYTFIFGAILSTISGGWLYFRHKKD